MAKIERCSKASPLNAFPIVLHCLLGESHEYPTESHHGVINALMDEASHQPSQYVDAIMTNRDLFLRHISFALSTKDSPDDTLPYVGQVTYAYRLVQGLNVLLSTALSKRTTANTNQNTGSIKLSAGFLASAQDQQNQISASTGSETSEYTGKLTSTDSATSKALQSIDANHVIFELSQPIYEILACLVDHTPADQLIFSDGTTNKRPVSSKNGYVESSGNVGLEKVINSQRHTIAVQRTMLVNELLYFIPNRESFHEHLFIPLQSISEQNRSNPVIVNRAIQKQASRSVLQKAQSLRQQNGVPININVSFGKDSDDEGSDVDNENPVVSSITPSQESLMEESASNSHVKNIIFRYYHILSRIAHSGSNLVNHVTDEENENKKSSNGVLFPLCLRQRALTYIQELMLAPDISELFISSRFHANDLLDLAFTCEQYSLLQVFLTISGEQHHHNFDNEQTEGLEFLELALPTLVYHFPICLNIMRAVLLLHPQAPRTRPTSVSHRGGNRVSDSTTMQIAGMMSKLLPLMISSSNKRVYLLGDYVKDLVEEWIFSLSIPFTNIDVDTMDEVAEPAYLNKAASNTTDLLLIIDDVKLCLDRMLLLLALSKPETVIPYFMKKILPLHVEHSQIVLQMMEVLSRSANTIVGPELLAHSFELLSYYQRDFASPSSSTLFSSKEVLVALILRSIFYLIPYNPPHVLEMCLQKITDIKTLVNTKSKQLSSSLLLSTIKTVEDQITNARAAANRKQGWLVRLTKVDRCKQELLQSESISQADKLLKDNESLVSMYLTMIEDHLPQPENFPLPIKLRIPGSWDHMVLTFKPVASTSGGGTIYNNSPATSLEVDIVIQTNQWTTWLKLINLLILSKRLATIKLIDYTFVIQTDSDRSLCINELHSLLTTTGSVVQDVRQDNSNVTNNEQVLLDKIFKRSFLELSELQEIREDMRKSGVFAMLYFDGTDESPMQGWKLSTDLDDNIGAITGDHAITSDIASSTPRLTTTFGIMMLAECRSSMMHRSFMVPSSSSALPLTINVQKKGLQSMHDVNWNRLRLMRSYYLQHYSTEKGNKFGNRLPPSPHTAPNTMNRLVSHMIANLPHWKEAVAKIPLPPPPPRSPAIGQDSARTKSRGSTKGVTYAQLCKVTGFITKQGSCIPTWKRRFCVLENRELRYYATRDAYNNRQNPLGIFMIDVDETSLERQGLLGLKLISFNPNHRSTLSLRFDTEEELAIWKEGFEEHTRLPAF